MMTSSKGYRYEHYQNDSHVILTVYIKNARKDQVSVEFTPDNVNLTVEGFEGDNSNKSFVLDLDLFQAIVPEQSNFTLYSTKIEVKLKKLRDGVMWKSLEKTANDPVSDEFPLPIASTVVNMDAPPTYPSSSRKGPKNWSALEKEAEKEEEKPEGEQALNALFKQIYANADENTRKAMNKSFVESGGTVLSTNWNDIGVKKTEVAPPDGMEARKWEQ